MLHAAAFSARADDLGRERLQCLPVVRSFAQRVGVVIAADGKIKEWHERVDARAWPAAVVGTL